MDLLLPSTRPFLRVTRTIRPPFILNLRSIDTNVLGLPLLSLLCRVWVCWISLSPSCLPSRPPPSPGFAPASRLQDLK